MTTPDREAETTRAIRWHVTAKDCAHSNDDVCPTCDFDGWYEDNYADCPWRDEDEQRAKRDGFADHFERLADS